MLIEHRKHKRGRLISKNIFLAFAVPVLLYAQSADTAPAPSDAPANSPGVPVTIIPSAWTPAANPPDQEPPGGKRAFGVLPNYRTASAEMEGTTITAKDKVTIAARDSFDFPLVLQAAVFAGMDQASDNDSSFGQGFKGYAHRVGAWYLDESICNMMTEGFFPAMLHQDPRYFRKGSGSIMGRTGYALSRVIITDKDGGAKQFNSSEWLGNATGVAISQAYHPDNRTARDATEFLLGQVGADAISQVIKEFWPDIRRKLFHRGKSQDAALMAR